MNSRVKSFIEDNLDLIDANDFEQIYELADLRDFGYTGELTSTFYEAGIDPLEHLNYVPHYYLYCQYLPEKFSIPKHIKKIARYGLWGVDGVEFIYIPEGCEFIDEHAFRGSDSLKHLYIPSSVTKIMSNAIEDDIIIHCPKGSYAHNFAENWSIARKYDYKYIEVPIV